MLERDPAGRCYEPNHNRWMANDKQQGACHPGQGVAFPAESQPSTDIVRALARLRGMRDAERTDWPSLTTE